MGGPRSTVTREEILKVFETDESFKAVASRIGMSPNTLRVIWKEAFGEDAFTARGKRIQAEAASITCKAIATTRVYKNVCVPCFECDSPVWMKSNQAAQLKKDEFICDDCRYDRTCPVCGVLVDGERGLSGHLRHRREAGDEAHLAYLVEQASSRWVGKTEDMDYVRCRVCGHWAETLARHLKSAHGINAETYRAKYGPTVRIRSLRLEEARSLAAKNRDGGFGRGDMKTILCPICGVAREGSKFLVPGTHDFRCDECRSKDEMLDDTLRWLDKSEPEDFVECRLCGWKGENITGHLMGLIHSGVSLSSYRQQFRQAPLFADGVMTFPTHKANLTDEDLTPFKDKKGRVQVALAADALGLVELTVRNYCKELGLPTRNRLAFQKRVLDSLAEIMEVPYEWEWSDNRMCNPKTGYRFRFDGRFSSHNLLVEVHGAQHHTQVSYWYIDQAGLEDLQERDTEKLRQALDLGFKVLVIRQDEPYIEVSHLRGRLAALGLSAR